MLDHAAAAADNVNSMMSYSEQQFIEALRKETEKRNVQVLLKIFNCEIIADGILYTLNWSFFQSRDINHIKYISKYMLEGAAIALLVLLRIPVFRDRYFRILKPIIKKGFESDPDLLDPNPQIP
jgi:hypothetical protein